MHWRANQPGAVSDIRSTLDSERQLQQYSSLSVATKFRQTAGDLDGSGRAYNPRDFQELFSMPDASETSTAGDSDENDDSSLPSILHVEMPVLTTGLTPFGYNRVLCNRIKEPMISESGNYDMLKYKPTFIHDVFMLPGSLANFLAKGSTEDCVKKMTPGLLAGLHAHVQPGTLQPCVLESRGAQDYVQGVVAFGLGRESRCRLHKHYQPFAKRKTVEVVVEIAIPTIPPSGAFELKRRAVAAHAFLWRNKKEHFEPERDGATWTLEEYLAGTLGPSQTLLRIEPNMRGDEDEDGYIGRDVQEYEVEAEQREVVYGGAGTLKYDRADTFTGW